MGGIQLIYIKKTRGCRKLCIPAFFMKMRIITFARPKQNRFEKKLLLRYEKEFDSIGFRYARSGHC